ncbi:phosphoglucosamine mutase, partial [Streptococcus suis]
DVTRVFVARDTLISGQLLEAALIAGILSLWFHVYILGVLATPGVADLVKPENASAGELISARHNPAQVNGIKFFAVDG